MCLFEKSRMIEKFRGTLYGLLVGDCFGQLFQESSILPKGSRLVLRKFLDSFENEPGKKGIRKLYTDDTALTLAVARTIESCKQIDQKNLAINYVDEFYRNVYRGFNASTIEIFAKLKHSNFDDVLYPAKEVLNSNSGDNGCAMFIAPIALVCTKNKMLNLNDEIRKAAALTHSNDEMAVTGAILLANAIGALIESKNNLDIDNFLSHISKKLNSSKGDDRLFEEQINGVKKLLNVDNPSEERIVNVLGHSEQAIFSVPTAIYCFLRSVKHKNNMNPFRQVVEYAIQLGGHSNTIASMSGALCGAHYGEAVISHNMLDQCEGFDEIKATAEHLFDAFK